MTCFVVRMVKGVTLAIDWTTNDRETEFEPRSGVLRELMYKKNLKAFYIIHPTFWTKMVTWWFTTFMAPAIKQKVHNLTGVEFLYSAMSPDQLEIPAFITEYDMSINGLRYFQPEAPT
uniref:CRAL-TRIO domain-containing protein n=1 Tax=Timema bartmani TaxID=61472 RepID=A0A7R9HYM1_9NEOP|nr:unnamed protein product [Timema bartmani]